MKRFSPIEIAQNSETDSMAPLDVQIGSSVLLDIMRSELLRLRDVVCPEDVESIDRVLKEYDEH